MIRIIFASIVSFLVCGRADADTVSGLLQQQFGYDTSTKSFCAMDRSAPSPGCIGLGRVDDTNHLIAMAGGIDVAAAKCDGITDDRAAIEAAAAALSAKGGTIRLPPGRLCHVSGLTMPANVTLDGGFRLPDNPSGSNAVAAYATLGGISLSSSGTIALGANSAVQNLLVKRAGMTFPAADTSAYAGTAITHAGADAPRISNVTVLGFHTCLAQTGTAVSRYRIEGFNCDGIDGEMITLPSWDSSVIRDVHNWPFSQQPSLTCQALTRSGHGLHLAGAQDDTTVDNVLSFGYARGFWFGQTGSISMGKIWADYPASCAKRSGSVGVWVGTYTTGVLIDQLWSWSSELGVVLDMTTGSKLKISSLFVANTVGDGVSIAGGDLHASMAEFKLIGAHAYSIGSSASHVYSRGTAESVGSTTLVAARSSVDPNNLDITFASDKPNGSAVFPDNLTPPAVASAATIDLPINAKSVTITGTADMNVLNGGWGDRVVRLRFSGAAKLHQSGNVQLATPIFVGSAGRHLDLVFDAAAAKWAETSRGPAPAVIHALAGTTSSTVAAASTVYLGASGAQTSEAATRWTAGRPYSSTRLVVAADTAPGTGKSYTYTLMVNGAATTVTGAVTNAGVGPLVIEAPLTVRTGDTLSVRLVTAPGAAASIHRYTLQLDD